MFKKIKQLLETKFIVLVALVYFFLAKTLSLVEDIFEDEHVGSIHLIYEIFLSLLTMLAIYIILREIIINRKRIKSLKTSLRQATKDNKNFSKQLLILKHDLSQVIIFQFKQWSLSKSEQDIAWLLLKGLTLEEIGEVRNTKEKTIRQQASAIYKKTGLKGRHELAAYFFEDLL